MAFTLIALCLGSFASGAEVSPVEKVITLLEDLKTETEEAGKKEASTYDTFACFCKDTTIEKSDAIKEEQDNIDEFAATLEEQTGISNAKQAETEELGELIRSLDKEMTEITTWREKEKAKYEATAADLSKAVSSLEGAIADMQAGKGASFLSTKKSIRKSVAMADALNLSPKQQRSITALLQTDADDAPEGDFSFHSDDIIATLSDLEKDFKAKKAEVDQIEGQNKKDYNEVMKSKTEEKKTAEGDKDTASADKDTADEEIAKATDSMVEEESKLKDDELYLKDLTAQCELKAREWDQRSKMRAEEVTALTAALKIITGKVKANAVVNKRAFVQHDDEYVGAPDIAADVKALKAPEKKQDARTSVEDDDVGDVDLSFLQVGSPRLKIASLVKQASTVSTSESQQAAQKDKVVSILVAKSKKLGSAVLASLAMRVAADPFLKVKKLIQDLIERLVTEAAEEATKKGWCDTELGKAESTRDSNMNKIMTLNAKLEEEISTLTTEIAELNDSLTKTTKLRVDEKAENMDTLDKAKAGLAAVKDAYDVLSSFYKKAAKGKVSLLQASPVNAPATSGGAYKGGQQKAGGILAMLDVIISDFERTIKVTTDSEKAAHREFVEFERTSKTSIASKETGKSQAESDLKSTDANIVESMDDLDKHQKMLDDVLMELEDLKPACVDTGMSYADRVQKRKDEIDALKKALCELDPEKVEDECK